MICVAFRRLNGGSVPLAAAFDDPWSGGDSADSFVATRLHLPLVDGPWVETHGYIHFVAMRRRRMEASPIPNGVDPVEALLNGRFRYQSSMFGGLCAGSLQGAAKVPIGGTTFEYL